MAQVGGPKLCKVFPRAKHLQECQSKIGIPGLEIGTTEYSVKHQTEKQVKKNKSVIKRDCLRPR